MQNQEAGGIQFVSGNWPFDPNKPTLIFIHGAALNKDCWETQVKFLTEFANTVAIDLPGHGTSKNQVKIMSPIMLSRLWISLILSNPLDLFLVA